MGAAHTPEPWSCGGGIPTNIWSEASRGIRIARTDFDGDEQHPEAIANARRIVACVNACAGIETESLEADGYGDNWAEVRRQRDAQFDAEMAWERAMMAAIGEDGIKSVSDAIGKLKAERDELISALEKILSKFEPGEKISDDAMFCFNVAANELAKHKESSCPT